MIQVARPCPAGGAARASELGSGRGGARARRGGGAWIAWRRGRQRIHEETRGGIDPSKCCWVGGRGSTVRAARPFGSWEMRERGPCRVLCGRRGGARGRSGDREMDAAPADRGSGGCKLGSKGGRPGRSVGLLRLRSDAWGCDEDSARRYVGRQMPLMIRSCTRVQCRM
ncbi:hypothetical protein CC85DRAFT_145845 [Cutaneotrichosporon oleaginosum]|uniref:Uncharacterized protein n=1 Tax=Cutaneotrichosporon oleaginosum TaxID=879819 RepID=A0A0J0XHR2_9TREE|nr:uncharacterized protein CC85DRAFT_145845 [Cutaneotrichosporon oleaginosum]KLT40660.1 hypothetical protein CC85DRAFT_145845 [Cutaneotrichosporon oleaginosum]